MWCQLYTEFRQVQTKFKVKLLEKRQRWVKLTNFLDRKLKKKLFDLFLSNKKRERTFLKYKYGNLGLFV